MKPLPWSHSAMGDFLNCPKAYYHKRVAKDVLDPPNDAGLAGDFTHKAFEAYLKYGTPLPDEYPDNIRDWPEGLKPPAAYKDYLDGIKDSPGVLHVECRYAITSRLEPCDFFAEDVWCRSILDILRIKDTTAYIIDHKTGRRKNDLRQLRLNALMVFLHHPEVEKVGVAYAWLKENSREKYVWYTREDEANMWRAFLPDIKLYKEAFRIEVFNPKQSGLCNGWCPVTHCEYWKPKRR
jgi:hypothetical protein